PRQFGSLNHAGRTASSISMGPDPSVAFFELAMLRILSWVVRKSFYNTFMSKGIFFASLDKLGTSRDDLRFASTLGPGAALCAPHAPVIPPD
ncbi:hypothetical protein, partial [Rhodovulum strictum]